MPLKSPTMTKSSGEDQEVLSRCSPMLAAAYDDGSLAMFFLDGHERVSAEVRRVLRSMLQADPSARPTAQELGDLWRRLDVGM